jgi:hypothetical protein
VKRLVCWGGTEGEDSFRHISRAFHSTARKLGIDTVWVPDHPRSLPALTPGSTVFCPDVYGHHIGPALPEVSYCLHNFDGSHVLCQTVEPERLLRLQVWTTAASGETWQPYRQFDREAQTLFQPWGSDLLAEEFLDPVFNAASRDVSFVGAVWSDQHEGVELGNEQTIRQLRLACMERGLRLVHRTQISDAEMLAATRAARLAPAFAGGWQVEKGYHPCRYYKTAAAGVLAFGNVAQVEEILGVASVMGETLEETLDAALSLGQTRYLNLVREQQRAISAYTYRESLAAIDRAFEEIRA